MSEASIDNDIDALVTLCDSNFGPAGEGDAAPPPDDVHEEGLKAVEGAALAVGELADTYALGGLAAGDMALTMVKMLAVCRTCRRGRSHRRPSVAALAFDGDERWFDISMDFCSACFTSKAVRVHEHVVGCGNASQQNPAAAINRYQLSAADMERISRLTRQGAVRLLQIGTGMLKGVLQGHTKSVNAVAYSPDGRGIATGSTDTTVRLWDVASGGCRAVLIGHSVRVDAVAYSPDGETIATGGYNCTVRLWDAASGESSGELVGHAKFVSSVAFSPDGATIASGSWDTTVRLWDAESGAFQTALQSPHSSKRDKVTGLAFSPDGVTIAVASSRCLRLWAMSSGKYMHRPMRSTEQWVSIRTVAYSPDGTTVAAGFGYQAVRLLQVASAKSRVLRGHADDVMAVACSPDGTTVATGSADKTVRLWDVASGECRAVLQGAGSVINGVAFSPDGTTIAACCADKTVRLFRAEYGLSLP